VGGGPFLVADDGEITQMESDCEPKGTVVEIDGRPVLILEASTLSVPRAKGRRVTPNSE